MYDAIKPIVGVACFLAMTAATGAQWVNGPLSGILRTPDGKPSLLARGAS